MSTALAVNEKFLPISPEKLDELRNKLLPFQAVETKDQRIAAENALKEGKLVLKTVEEQRKSFTSKLDEVKKKAMEPEKEIAAILAPIADAITKQAQKEFQEAEKARKAAEEKAAEERRQKQAIIDANSKSQADIAKFVADTNNQIANAKDNASLDQLAKDVRKHKYSPQDLAENKASLEQDFEDQRAILLKLISKAKKDESVREIAAQKAETAAAHLEEIQDQAQEQSLEAAMDADLAIQASAQAIGQVSGTRTVWVHELVDINQVPREYLMLNDAAVKQAIKDGIHEIAGIKITQTVGRSGR